MIVTYTGKYFDFHNMENNEIDINDITHALARINRFVGHSSRAYSVGEHTIIGIAVAEKMGYTPLQKLQWLIHDFTEAYVGDCPSPLKAILPEYQRIEKQVAQVITEFVGIPPLTPEEKYLVDRVDRTMLAIEMRDLTLHDHSEHINEYTYMDILSDNFFILPPKDMQPGLVTSTLRHLYETLLEEVKKDEE